MTFVSNRNRLLLLLLLFFLAFGIRFAVLSTVPGLGPGSDLKKIYAPIAVNLLNGHGFAAVPGQPDYKLVPLYPFFLAALYAVFGRAVNVGLALSVVAGISCVLVFLAARPIFGKKAAVLSAVGFAVYPPLVLLTSMAISDDLFILFNLVFLLGLVRFLRSPGYLSIAVVGVAIGLAGLTKPIPVLLPLLVVGAILVYRPSGSFQLRKCGLLLIAFLVTVLPWSIRTYAVFHEVSLLGVSRMSVGDLLFVGTLENQLVPAPNNERFSVYLDESREAINKEAGAEVSDRIEQGKTLTKVVARKIFEEPGDYLRLLPRKFARFWYASDSGRYDTLFILLQGSLLVVGLLGLVSFIRRNGWRQSFALYPALLYYPAVHTLSFPLARYSMPVMPLVIMFSAYALVQFLERWRRRAAV